MRIAIASDIHLEFGDLNIQNTEGADVLVLAGDIMIANDLHDHPAPQTPYPPAIIRTLGSRQLKAQEYRDFIARCAFQFPHVVAIAGNHEFYHGKWIGSIDTLRNEYGRHPNVHFLEDNSVTIDGVTFVGATLWTDMNNCDPLTLHTVGAVMNDFRLIRHDGNGYTKLRAAHAFSRHVQSKEYFGKTIDATTGPVVVVSHMAPSSLSVHEDYKREHHTNGAYYSDLGEFILDRPQIALWCHGHMHNPSDYLIGDTRVVCNPRGYVNYERGSQEADPYYPMIVDINVEQAA